jgi:hypothetical protein
MSSESQNMALTGILSTQLLQQQFVDDFQTETSARPDKIVDRRAGRRRHE